MPSVDDSVREFLDNQGFVIQDSDDRLTITGQPEVNIVLSLVYIISCIPVILFIAIRFVHLYKQGFDFPNFLWMFLAMCISILWVYFGKRILAPGPMVWLIIGRSGITTYQNGFLPKESIESIGLKSKKLAGVLSSAYLDNHFRKAIYVESRGFEVELLVFETKRIAMEKDINVLIGYIADRIGLKEKEA